MDKMTKNFYGSRRYEFDLDKGIYDKIAKNSDLKIIFGKSWDHLLVRGDQKNLILIRRDFDNKKEIIKVHSTKPETVQSKLEKITGVDFSKYRTC